MAHKARKPEEGNPDEGMRKAVEAYLADHPEANPVFSAGGEPTEHTLEPSSSGLGWRGKGDFMRGFSDNLRRNPAAVAMAETVEATWDLSNRAKVPGGVRWALVDSYETLPPGCQLPLSFEAGLGGAVHDPNIAFSLSLTAHGDEEKGFGDVKFQMPVMASTSPLDVQKLMEHKVTTIVGKDGERPVEWTLRDVIEKLGVETYRDPIHLIGFLPMADDDKLATPEGFETQYSFSALLKMPAKFTMICGNKLFGSSPFMKGPGQLPLVNPINEHFFKAVWMGDDKTIGPARNSNTFIFIVEPVEGVMDSMMIRSLSPQGSFRPDDDLTTSQMKSMGLEIGGIGTVDGRESGVEYQEGDATRDKERKPLIIKLTLLGVRQEEDHPEFTAKLTAAEEDLLLPRQLRED